jgi:hypothetical protein
MTDRRARIAPWVGPDLIRIKPARPGYAHHPDCEPRKSGMKIAFIVYNEHYNTRVMELLEASGIDYYTRWEQAVGKGHGTEPHLGRGSYASKNSVLMIAFQEETPLDALVQAITHANAGIGRPDDRIRLFQLPLERML